MHSPDFASSSSTVEGRAKQELLWNCPPRACPQHCRGGRRRPELSRHPRLLPAPPQTPASEVHSPCGHNNGSLPKQATLRHCSLPISPRWGPLRRHLQGSAGPSARSACPSSSPRGCRQGSLPWGSWGGGRTRDVQAHSWGRWDQQAEGVGLLFWPSPCPGVLQPCRPPPQGKAVQKTGGVPDPPPKNPRGQLRFCTSAQAQTGRLPARCKNQRSAISLPSQTRKGSFRPSPACGVGESRGCN